MADDKKPLHAPFKKAAAISDKVEPWKAKFVDEVLARLDNAELEETPVETDVDGVLWKKRKKKNPSEKS